MMGFSTILKIETTFAMILLKAPEQSMVKAKLLGPFFV